MSSQETIILGAFVLTIVMFFTLAVYAGVRQGVNPCRFGISEQCPIESMDEICYRNKFTMPACRFYCRNLLAKSHANKDLQVCDSEYCTDPNNSMAAFLWCESEHVERKALRKRDRK